MSQHDHDLWTLADAIQMDLRAATAKLVQLRAELAALDLPFEEPRCPECGYRSALNMPSVREHRAEAHGIRQEALEPPVPT